MRVLSSRAVVVLLCSTKGAGIDATQFMYRGKITPAVLYFTK